MQPVVLLGLKSILRLLQLLAFVVLLASCGHTPVTRTLFDAFGSGDGVETNALAPGYRYLKVTFGRNEALLVLGYVQPLPDAQLQTWYSSTGETIQIQNGRIVSTHGLPIDWLDVRYEGLPTWESLKSDQRVEFTRIRDQMPGYEFGIEERIYLYPIQPPFDTSLVGLEASNLLWFEEVVQIPEAQKPIARYGLREEAGKLTVVYGEQCFDLKKCLAWQTWPAQP